MKSFTCCLLAASAMFAADGNSDSAKADVKIQIVAPVKIKNISPIDFGTIVVDDYNKKAEVYMTFNGLLPNFSQSPSTKMTYVGCAPFKGNTAHTPGAFVVERDAAEAPTAGRWMSHVKFTSFDQFVELSGGHGGPVQMVVCSDIPAEDFIAASPVEGVLTSRFQVAGALLIPAHCLGVKTGVFNIGVAYM